MLALGWREQLRHPWTVSLVVKPAMSPVKAVIGSPFLRPMPAGSSLPRRSMQRNLVLPPVGFFAKPAESDAGTPAGDRRAPPGVRHSRPGPRRRKWPPTSRSPPGTDPAHWLHRFAPAAAPENSKSVGDNQTGTATTAGQPPPKGGAPRAGTLCGLTWASWMDSRLTLVWFAGSDLYAIKCVVV